MRFCFGNSLMNGNLSKTMRNGPFRDIETELIGKILKSNSPRLDCKSSNTAKLTASGRTFANASWTAGFEGSNRHIAENTRDR